MTKMTNDVESYARSYIDSALESRRRIGRSAEISEEDYEAAVQRATDAFGELMTARQPREDEHEPVSN
jgi:hypothetical protein